MPTAKARTVKKKTGVLTGPAKKGPAAASTVNLYTLEVFLAGGPIPEKYQDTEISRTIEMLGTHTLDDLHEIIFDSFGREEEHLWEFQIGGKSASDRKNKRYGPLELEDERAADAAETTLDSLELEVDQAFGYIFDFGDGWAHQINVVRIEATTKKLARPRVVKKVGKAPPQYPDEE